MKIKFTGIKGVGSKIHHSSTNIINAVYSVIKHKYDHESNSFYPIKINMGVRKPSYFTFIIYASDTDYNAYLMKYLLDGRFIGDLKDKLLSGGKSPYPLIDEIVDSKNLENDCIINVSLTNLKNLTIPTDSEFFNTFSTIISPDKHKVTGENMFAVFSNSVGIDVLSNIVDLLNNDNRNTREGEFASASLSYMDDSVHIVSGSCYPTIHNQIKSSIENLYREHLRTSN